MSVAADKAPRLSPSAQTVIGLACSMLVAEKRMQPGMIGLGWMGSGMVRRPLQKSHNCVVHDSRAAALAALCADGAASA